MISRLGLAISRVFQRTCPDPFVLAIMLTLIAGLLIMLLTTKTLPDGTVVRHDMADVIHFWQDGFWSLLAFSMQMCLILVTGHALASSPPAALLIRRFAAVPKTATQAAVLVGLTASLLACINWGLGLIVGALLARHVGQGLQQRGIPHHYPLLAAAGYLGLLVWHGGFSGSAPLKVTNEADVAEVLGGLPFEVATIGLDQSVFSLMNLVITGGLIAIAVVLAAMMTPRDPRDMRPFENFVAPVPPAPKPARLRTLPDFLDNTPFFSILLAIPMLIWLADLFIAGDSWPLVPESRSWRQIGLNDVNVLFLALGLLLHGSPMNYVRAIDEAVRGCGGIILQFPLYAGIMGMMQASGLTALMADGIASLSNETTLPIMTFFSAGIVNLFVPSGGGQWAVQGPVAMQAAHDLGVEYPKMLMAVAYGDELTNMLQPFWALPLLGITGVKARDIVGFTSVIMVAGAIWIVLGLLVF